MISGSGDAPITFTARSDVVRFIAHTLVHLPAHELNNRVFRIEGERTVRLTPCSPDYPFTDMGKLRATMSLCGSIRPKAGKPLKSLGAPARSWKLLLRLLRRILSYIYFWSGMMAKESLEMLIVCRTTFGRSGIPRRL